jgi:hypothetical protein
MLFESKRLLELAGLPVEETSNVLTESAIKEFTSNDGVTAGEDDPEKKKSNEDDEVSESESNIRETIRSEIERMWSSGQVFGTKSKNKHGEITVGFPGIGFKK